MPECFHRGVGIDRRGDVLGCPSGRVVPIDGWIGHRPAYRFKTAAPAEPDLLLSHAPTYPGGEAAELVARPRVLAGIPPWGAALRLGVGPAGNRRRSLGSHDRPACRRTAPSPLDYVRRKPRRSKAV